MQLEPVQLAGVRAGGNWVHEWDDQPDRPLQPASGPVSPLGIYLKELKAETQKDNLHTHIHSSIMHNSQKVEAAHMSDG